MALQCQMSVSNPSITAGQSSQATLTIYNPNAVAVSVTGVELTYADPQGAVMRPSVNPSLIPIGPGQPTAIPALTVQSFGPFPIAIATVAASNGFQSVPVGSIPNNIQGALQPVMQVFIGARVTASDGSINEAGKAGMLVSPTLSPPMGFQGGVAQFGAPNNSNLVAAGVG